MRNRKSQLWSHIGLVTAAAFVLFIATVAWFFNSWRVDTAPMTFAAQSIGSSAALHESLHIENRRLGEQNTTLTETVTFQKNATSLEDKTFTIRDLVPGQVVYFLLELTDGDALALKELTLYNAAGDALTAPEPGALTDCLSIQFLPLNQTQLSAALAETADDYTTVLTRTNPTGPLDAALFSQTPLPIPGTILTGATGYPGYVLSIYYDPIYQQPLSTTTLPGSVSFSLSVTSVADQTPDTEG